MGHSLVPSAVPSTLVSSHLSKKQPLLKWQTHVSRKTHQRLLTKSLWRQLFPKERTKRVTADAGRAKTGRTVTARITNIIKLPAITLGHSSWPRSEKRSH